MVCGVRLSQHVIVSWLRLHKLTLQAVDTTSHARTHIHTHTHSGTQHKVVCTYSGTDAA